MGLRGKKIVDNDFRTFGMLISMSKAARARGAGEGGGGGGGGLRDFEYKKSVLLSLLGFDRACELGDKVRRILEEGRIRYLRDSCGFDDVRLVRYCDREVTGDNLALIARRRKMRGGEVTVGDGGSEGNSAGDQPISIDHLKVT